MTALPTYGIICFKSNYCVAFAMMERALTEQGLAIGLSQPENGRIDAEWIPVPFFKPLRLTAQFLDSQAEVTAVWLGPADDQPAEADQQAEDKAALVLAAFVRALDHHRAPSPPPRQDHRLERGPAQPPDQGHPLVLRRWQDRATAGPCR